jgi:hypothetical protein
VKDDVITTVADAVAAIEEDGWNWKFVSQDLKFEPEVLEAALVNEANTLDFLDAPEDIRKDHQIMLRATHISLEHFFASSTTLLADVEFVTKAILDKPRIVADFSWLHQNKVPEEIKTHPQIVKILKDKKFSLRLVEDGTGNDLNAIWPDHLSDKNIVLRALQKRGDNWHFVPDTLKSDEDIIRAAIQEGPRNVSILKYCPTDFFETQSKLIEKRIKDAPNDFANIPDSLKKDKNYLLKFLAINGEVLNHLDRLFWDDPEIIEAALSSTESGNGSYSVHLEWFQSRSTKWFQTHPDYVHRMMLIEGLGDFLCDKPNLDLQTFTAENYQYQTFILICKLLDAYGVCGLDPAKILSIALESEGSWVDARLGQFCLYHDALTQSVQKSFGMHFNIMASIDLEGSDNSGNDFLADSNPFLMAAVNFVYECLTDPEHEIYQPDL